MNHLITKKTQSQTYKQMRKKSSKKFQTVNQSTNDVKQEQSNLNEDLYKLFQELHQKKEKEIQILIQMNEDIKDPDMNQKMSTLIKTTTQEINYEKYALVQKTFLKHILQIKK